MSASYNNTYKQDNGGASSADHNVFDALDPKDGFLPAFRADRLMGVDLCLYRCGCGLAHQSASAIVNSPASTCRMISS